MIPLILNKEVMFLILAPVLTCLLNNEYVLLEENNCTEHDDFEFCRYEEESCLVEPKAFCIGKGLKESDVISRGCANKDQDDVNAQMPGCIKITKLNISTITTCYCGTDNCNRNCKAKNCKTINTTVTDNVGSHKTSNIPIHFEQCEANCTAEEEKLETTAKKEDKSTTLTRSTKHYKETKQNVITKTTFNDEIVTSKSAVDGPFKALTNVFLLRIADVIRSFFMF